MRSDAQVAHPGIVGEDDVERRRDLPRSRPLVEDVCDGGGADGAAGEGVLEGDLQFRGADPVEELEDPGDLATEVLAALGQGSTKASALGQEARSRSRPRSS